jgi:hypothetical protein
LQNVGQNFIVLDFFHGRKILKVDERDPQNLEKIFLLGGDHAGGKGVRRRLMSPVQETQSMRERRLLHGRLPCKGGGLTGMLDTVFLLDNFGA